MFICWYPRCTASIIINYLLKKKEEKENIKIRLGGNERMRKKLRRITSFEDQEKTTGRETERTD